MTKECGPYKPTAGGCTPGTVPFWARRPEDPSPVLLFEQTTCVLGRAVITLTRDKAGNVQATGFSQADRIKAVVYDKRGASCEDPLYVAVCGNPASVPALSALACDGVTTVDVTADESVKQVVNAPGTALAVRMCGPSTAVKIEFSETVLYSASTEQTVVRVRIFDEDAGAWALQYENLDGTPFAGPIPADLYEVTAQVHTTRIAEPGCLAGVPVTRRTTSMFDSEAGALESELVEYVDGDDNVTPGPAAPGTFTLGACPAVVRENLIYLERNGGVVTMADILAATGAVAVHSVTVKQINGRGAVTGDSGSGVPLDQGETWSWGVVSQNQTESLNTSALSMDAAGGEQRITAIYTK